VIAAFRDSDEQAFIIGRLIANEGSESKVRFGGQLG